ncbi:MAG TPA: PqqD family protein [Candidatus Ozemobacteraceae bacterium]|nr:PqqD family protein [Candidatus Ozemobacteraceae bacterium]
MLRLNRANLAWQQFQQRVFLLTVRNNHMHELNAVGSHLFLWLWEHEGITESELVQRVCDSFDVSPEHAGADVERFLNDLQTKEILTRE